MDEAKWKLVPVEPTPEMLSAVWSLKHSNNQEIARQLYDAMLAASPAPALPESRVAAIASILMDEIRITETASGPRISGDDLASAARRIAALASPTPALPESGVEDGDNGSGPYTCTACLSATWNDDDRCDACREEALAASVPAPAPAPAPVDAAGLVAEPVAWRWRFEPYLPWHLVERSGDIPKIMQWPRAQIEPLYTPSALAAAAKREAALVRERDEARAFAGLGCDAADGGPHTLMAQGREQFCIKCGYMIKSPSIHERARAAEARVTAAEAERDAERERCAQIVDEWSKPQTMKLHAGEMTAREVRTSKAILKGLVAAIRKETTA